MIIHIYTLLHTYLCVFMYIAQGKKKSMKTTYVKDLGLKDHVYYVPRYPGPAGYNVHAGSCGLGPAEVQGNILDSAFSISFDSMHDEPGPRALRCCFVCVKHI